MALDYLANDIHEVASRSGTWAEQRQQEQRVADAIRQLVAKAPDDPSLTGSNQSKLFPLASAAMNGYALVVEALLQSPAVRQQVNAPSLGGATPIALAQLALPLNLWACNADLLFTEFSPVIEVGRLRADYYANAPDEPFERVQRLLVEAGATVNREAMAKAWRQHCPTDSPVAPSMLAGESEATPRLILLAQRIWRAHMRRLEAHDGQLVTDFEGIPSAVRSAPPPVATPVGNALEIWESNRICRTMAEPDIGKGWPWAGSARVRAAILIRGGLPVAVTVSRVEGDMSPAADRALAWIVSRAIAKFQCRGELRTILEFQFRVS
ncbi:MAG: hypothetical protein EOP39_05855 [Rubrivivax sp.]|nr:MAG: hypothetical protein EOP39_05855 [Rubrivivax sp.]